MRTEDGEIIRKCLNGEPEAFGFLVDKYKESIYGFAYAKLLNFQDAEDVTQEVFLKAFRKLRTLRRWENFHAWLYSISSNLCKIWLRARSRRPDGEFLEDKDPEILDKPSIHYYRESQARESLNESLHEALESLPEMYRQVLTLYYLSGMSSTEIARFLGTSRTTVLQRLHRARLQLKEEMLAMMNTTFEAQKLRGGFTFRILEGVKRTKIQPMPRTAGLPWGISLAASVIIAALTLNPSMSIVNPTAIPSGSSLPAESKVLKTGEIPVDILEVSHVSVLASRQGDGEDGLPKLPEMHNAAPTTSLGKGDTWRKRADMPTPRCWLSTSVVNGRVYAIGGSVGISTHTSVVEEYDPATNTWTQKADMSTVRDQPSTSVVNGKIYAIGGFDEDRSLKSVEEYDPARDRWTERADMPTARQNLSTSVVNGKIYAFGGWNSNQKKFLSIVEEYDPGQDTWKKKSDMPTARGLLSASAVNGKIYVIGGSNRRMGTNDFEGIPVVEEYDPMADTWRSRADMPTARWSLATSAVGDRIFAVGGGQRMTPYSVVEEYDPAIDTWIKRAEMPTARGALSTSVIAGKIYAIGGAGEFMWFLQTVEEYDPGFVPGESVRADGKFWLPWGKVK